jgi:hypothetical protein
MPSRASRIDLLYFSRGRGKGHALPDITVVRRLRELCPDVNLMFVSYAQGAGVFRSFGEPLIDLELPEANPFADTLVRAAGLIRDLDPGLVVGHEEPSAMPAAAIFATPTVFMTHWFHPPQDSYAHSLRFADEIMFLEREGLFPEPECVNGRVRYMGPLIRHLNCRPADRDRVRAELGFETTDHVVLMIAGTPSEEREPTRGLVLSAFDLWNDPNKRLIWMAGKDRNQIAEVVGDRQGILVIDTDWGIDRLMVASDAAITKGTYNTGKELNILGVPSISLSHGKNHIDDLFAKNLETNVFLWAKETSPELLAQKIEQALAVPRSVPDFSNAEVSCAAAVAGRLAKKIAGAREIAS